MPELLSPHFSRSEFERSQTAARRGYDNTMGPDEIRAASALCRNVLEPLRKVVGPISISSGYRSPKVNRAVGGSRTSQHQAGEAADISCNALGTADLFALMRLLHLPFDQVIEEFGSWVHVSHGPRHRRQAILARRKRLGGTSYTRAPGAVYTEAVKRVVAEFQYRNDLNADGLIGPVTRRALGL